MIAALRALFAALLALLQRLFSRRAPTQPPDAIARPGASPAPSAPAAAPRAPIVLHWRTPAEYFEWMIGRWEIYHNREGRLITYQNVANDSGNYNSRGERVGTNYGVSAAAYEGIIGRPPTEADMRAITLGEAARIGAENYYRKPGFARLPWCPATEIAVDWGWGSGPQFAIRRLQRVLGIGEDGAIGPITQRAFAAWIGDTADSMAAACREISTARRAHWWSISEPGSRNAQFRAIWIERADWYLPSNSQWWKL